MKRKLNVLQSCGGEKLECPGVRVGMYNIAIKYSKEILTLQKDFAFILYLDLDSILKKLELEIAGSKLGMWFRKRWCFRTS